MSLRTRSDIIFNVSKEISALADSVQENKSENSRSFSSILTF